MRAYANSYQGALTNARARGPVPYGMVEIEEGGGREPTRSRARLPRMSSSHRVIHTSRLLVAAVVGIGTILVLEQRPTDWETASFRAVNELPGALFYPVWVVMQAGSIGAVAVAGFLALAFRRIRLAFDLLAAGTSAWVLATVVKAAVGRGRPADLLQDVIIRGAPFAGEGYVSGHAAVAAALAAAAAPYLTRGWQVAVWLAAFVVAFARVYVGAHLPLDVLGGAALGWAIGCLVHVLLGRSKWLITPGPETL